MNQYKIVVLLILILHIT